MTLRCRLGAPVEEPPEPNEIRVAFLPDFASAGPSRYKVTRGGIVVGRLVDLTTYPPTVLAVRHPQLGYIMTAAPAADGYLWTAETPSSDGRWSEIFGGPWRARRQALEAMLGEPVEEVVSVAPKGRGKR